MKKHYNKKHIHIHYHRPIGDYMGWGIHLWGDHIPGTDWNHPLYPTGKDEFGIHWRIEVEGQAGELNFLIHRGEDKDTGRDHRVEIRGSSFEVWLVQGLSQHFYSPSEAQTAIALVQIGDIQRNAEAHWLTRDTVIWPIAAPPGTKFTLHHSLDAELSITPDGIQGGSTLELSLASDRLEAALADRYPHLSNCLQLRLYEPDLDHLRGALRGQLAVSAVNHTRSYIRATGLQIPGILDELFQYSGRLGVDWAGGIPSIRLWAPTARAVRIHLYRLGTAAGDKQPEISNMSWDPKTGVWSAAGERDWAGCEYLFEVDVFMPRTGKFVRSLVTDPYSHSLSRNSTRSQIVDINAPSFQPEGWGSLEKPALEHLADSVIYELHIRDFSAFDSTIPEKQRGTYLAFTHHQSNGMRHLRQLADAGVTHIHLLPVNDFGSVDEERSRWESPDYSRLADEPPDSHLQQEAVSRVRDLDGYNWGYDPLHWLATEGSYSLEPDGPGRTLEFRQMVQALNQSGLRVVLDVVFNHLYARDLDDPTTLERIVPGYYLRQDPFGNTMTSTCCPDTATEHLMMEKLMVDALVHWAVSYKVDGFRFDLMGHHLVRNMAAVNEALRALSLEKDGVDGQKLLLYGEGWDFGGLAHNTRGPNASQANIPGMGIGVFNDRIRDSVRGGGAFRGYEEAGFAFGGGTAEDYSSLKPVVMLSLAGNLAAFPVPTLEGGTVPGGSLDFHGSPAGFARQPWESIQYISSHDNETWFDAVQIKAGAAADLEDRLQIYKLGLSLLCVAQGIPFFLAGDELLRSKSLDRNSFNSGDWFNQLDFTYQSNNWGVGLPPRAENAAHWIIQKPLLSREDLRPAPEQIRATLTHFEEMLRIRRSSYLFRLRSAEAVMSQVSFPGEPTRESQDVIVMRIVDDSLNPRDPVFSEVLVLINVGGRDEIWVLPGASAPPPGYVMHPVQVQSADARIAQVRHSPEAGSFTLPGRTVLVYVVPRERVSTAD